MCGGGGSRPAPAPAPAPAPPAPPPVLQQVAPEKEIKKTADQQKGKKKGTSKYSNKRAGLSIDTSSTPTAGLGIG